MEKLFKYFGKKAGQTFKKSKWIYDSVLGDEEEALKSEYQFGLYMAKDIQASGKICKSELLDEIGIKLAGRLNTLHRFNFFVLESDEVNAFALPGGFIFFNKPIIDFFEDNIDETAFVLAHEMAHVVKGHSFNRLLAEYSINTISRFIRATGLLQSAAKELTVKYFKSRYSRDNELEADHFAVRLMTAAKYNPQGALSFFAKLKKMNKEGSVIPSYFSSHPSHDIRIEQVKKKM